MRLRAKRTPQRGTTGEATGFNPSKTFPRIPKDFSPGHPRYRKMGNCPGELALP
jgi:hypothetical protein